MYTLGSIYAGIGGLDLGFERAGFEVRWQVELDSFCRSALASHWPDVHREWDARRVSWKTLERVDVITAGFPCQDLSNAGTRLGLSGDHSSLWWMVRRATRVLRPKILVVENVTGLLVRGLPIVLGSLARIGYDAEWSLIRASEIGAPHRRARLFIVAYSNQTGCRIVSTPLVPRGPSGNDVDGCGSHVENASRERLQGTNIGALAYASRGRQHGHTSGSITFPARPGEQQHDWEPSRCVESALGTRVNGFSRRLVGSCDSSLWRRKALEAIGNAVVPQVAELVALRVREILEGTP